MRWNRRSESCSRRRPTSADELAAVEKLQKGYHNMRAELGKVIVGQEAVIEELLIALFCRGHALLVGVPGLAKTLLISTLARDAGPELQPHPVHARPDAVATSPARK